jgi:hypothetical protein
MYTEESREEYREKEKPTLYDETGVKGNLLHQKLRLFTSPQRHLASILNWRSRHWDEAVVGGNAAATWAPLISRRSNEGKSS